MRRGLLLAGLLSMALFSDASDAVVGSETRPNIIHIMADDLGFGDLACYGHPFAQTPRIDRLAQEGTRYTQYYQMSPVCSPSRAAILTGRFPASLGIHCYLSNVGDKKHRETFGSVDYLDPSVPTVARLLQQVGYATGHFGKWHLGGEAPLDDPNRNAPIPEKYGFDEAFSARSSGRQLPFTSEQQQHPRRYTPEVIADCVIDFIRRNKDKPFYAQAWFRIPHSELDPSGQEVELYRERSPRTVEYTGSLAMYYGSITAMDHQTGRILEALDKLGLKEDTVVIFTSDNGPENQAYHSSHAFSDRSAGPFRGRKRSLYEGGVRAPFIVRWPGRVSAGRVDDSTVISGVDWLPTVCALAGVPTGGLRDLAGEDVLEALLSGTGKRRKALFWDWRFPIVWTMRPIDVSPSLAIREGNWKLLMNPDGSRQELYHIPGDPMELDNRLREMPEVARKLEDWLREWYVTLPEGPRWDSSRLYPWPHN